MLAGRPQSQSFSLGLRFDVGKPVPKTLGRFGGETRHLCDSFFAQISTVGNTLTGVL